MKSHDIVILLWRVTSTHWDQIVIVVYLEPSLLSAKPFMVFFFYSNLQLIIFQIFFFFFKEVDWKSGYMGQWTSQPIPYPKAAIIIYVSVSYPRYGYLSSIFSGWEISVIFFFIHWVLQLFRRLGKWILGLRSQFWILARHWSCLDLYFFFFNVIMQICCLLDIEWASVWKTKGTGALST